MDIPNTQEKLVAYLESNATRALWVLESGELRYRKVINNNKIVIVQELCESRGGRPGLSVLTSLLVSVDVKLY